MAYPGSALSALPEDLGVILSNYMADTITISNSSL